MSEIIIEPIQIEGVTDYHVHCDYSIDAQGSIEEYCDVALRRNLAEICFTTHYDFNPNCDGRVNFININGEHKPTSIENLEPYIDDVMKAAEKFYLKGISVKLGVEIGWFEGCEEEVEKLKERYNFDYVLCGIHEIENICYCCKTDYKNCFERYTMEKAAETYFKSVNNAINSKLFHTIAHLDYYQKYGQKFYGDNIKVCHRLYLEETFNNLIETKTSLEINTAAIRHELDDYYPSMEIINKSKKAGVNIAHLGSDAHKPEQVGFDFEMAVSLVPTNILGGEE